MKKTTKMLLVLAATVAMAIGTVGTVMAADEYDSISKWSEPEKGVWTAVNAEDKEIKDNWAKDPSTGLWYYFDKFGEMAADEFIQGDDGWYYVDKSGAMATGWVKFTADEKNPAVLDAVDEANGEDLLVGSKEDPNNPYADTVWTYFGGDGYAMEDEWFKDQASGKWHYFEGVVMIANDYSYEVDDELYGFDANGYELLGWQEVRYNKIADQEGPLDASIRNMLLGKTYYDPETGIIMEAGWEKLDDTWYYFGSVNGSRFEDLEVLDGDATVALLNTYFQDGADNYYFDAEGKMVKGQKAFSKGTYISTSEDQYMTADNASKKKYGPKTTKLDPAITVFFHASNGNQQYKDQGGNYYLPAGATNVYVIGENEYTKKSTVISFNDVVTDGQLPGKMVTSDYGVIVKDGSKYYYYGKGGKVVADSVTTIFGLSIATKAKGEIIKDNGVTTKVGSRKYSLSDANGTLYVAGAAVAYGANSKTTADYSVELVYADANSKTALEKSVANVIENDFAIGEKVKYTMLSYYKDVQFTNVTATVKDGDTILFTIPVTCSGSKSGSKTHGYNFEFKMADIDAWVDDMDYKVDDEIVVEVAFGTAPVFSVEYNGTDLGNYIEGEEVVVKATEGIFAPEALNSGVVDAAAITGVTGVAYVVDDEEEVVYRNQITFEMPDENVEIEANEVDVYKVTITAGAADVEVLPFEGKFMVGETVTFTAVDADDVNVIVEKVTFGDDKDAFADLEAATTEDTGVASFVMIDKDVKVEVKASEAATTATVTLDTIVATFAAIDGDDAVTGTAMTTALGTVEVGVEVEITFEGELDLVATRTVGSVEVNFTDVKVAYDKDANLTTITFTMPANDVTIAEAE